MFGRVLNGWQRLFRGDGYVSASLLNPGNRGNAPAPAPVQAGNYQFIQSAMFPVMSLAEIGTVPPAYRDTQEFGQRVYGLSGLTGGGATDAMSVHQSTEPVLFYDESTRQYYHL